MTHTRKAILEYVFLAYIILGSWQRWAIIEMKSREQAETILLL